MIKFKHSTLLLLFWFLVLGCQENETDILNSDINDAKNWFDKNQQYFIQGTLKNSSARIESNFTKSPDWSKCKVHQMNNGLRIVEVILNYDNFLLFSESGDIGTSKPNVINSMLLAEISPGLYRIYLLKTYPENLNDNLGIKDFSNLNFSKIPSGFSGSTLTGMRIFLVVGRLMTERKVISIVTFLRTTIPMEGYLQLLL